MELLQIQLQAGETKRFEKAGVWFEVIDAPGGSFDVDFYSRDYKLNDSVRGAVSGLYLENEFGSFTIKNGAAYQVITLLLLENGRGGSRRLSLAGSVSVTDAALADTAAGAAFMGAEVIPSSSTQYGGVFLVNAGTKVVVVDQIRLMAGAAAAAPAIYMGMNTAALSAVGKTQQTGYTYAKDVNGAAATAQIWNYTSTTKWVPDKYLSLVKWTAAGLPASLLTSRPIRLLPGQVLGLAQNSMDSASIYPNVIFEWREI